MDPNKLIEEAARIALGAHKRQRFEFDLSQKRVELGTARVKHYYSKQPWNRDHTFEFTYIPASQQLEVRFKGCNSVYVSGQRVEEGSTLPPEFDQAFQNLWASYSQK